MLCNALGILPPATSARAGSSTRKPSRRDHSGPHRQARGEARRGLPCVQGCIIACSNVSPTRRGRPRLLPAVREHRPARIELRHRRRRCRGRAERPVQPGGHRHHRRGSGHRRGHGGRHPCLRRCRRGEGSPAPGGCRTPMGRIIGSGVAVTGRVLGVRRIPPSRARRFPRTTPGRSRASA